MAEFLELFFPKLAGLVDAGSIEFLPQEHFSSLPKGGKHIVDLLAKARFKQSPAFFLIHTEHQSSAPKSFAERFILYCASIYTKHRLPVYPIAIYSQDRPLKAQPSTFRMGFPDLDVLRVRFRVVQLNRLELRTTVHA